MSKVSGLSLKTFPMFIENKFGNEGLERWQNSLSGEAKDVFNKPLIGLDDWYDLNDFFIKPTKLICDLFYQGDEKSAWEMGRFSAEFALKGVLKVFVRMGTTLFLMSRVARIVSKYYDPIDMKITKSGQHYAQLAIIDFPDYHILLEYRICGWIERALEISGCKNITIDATHPQDQDNTVEIMFRWE